MALEFQKISLIRFSFHSSQQNQLEVGSDWPCRGKLYRCIMVKFQYPQATALSDQEQNSSWYLQKPKTMDRINTYFISQETIPHSLKYFSLHSRLSFS